MTIAPPQVQVQDEDIGLHPECRTAWGKRQRKLPECWGWTAAGFL